MYETYNPTKPVSSKWVRLLSLNMPRRISLQGFISMGWAGVPRREKARQEVAGGSRQADMYNKTKTCGILALLPRRHTTRIQLSTANKVLEPALCTHDTNSLLLRPACHACFTCLLSATLKKELASSLLPPPPLLTVAAFPA